jgi:transcriptional regulator with XRE-family HTH domain
MSLFITKDAHKVLPCPSLVHTGRSQLSLVHDQLRFRRRQLGLRQSDLLLRAGIGRQQYHRLESGGNPNLDTLELAAAGLDMVVMLIPKERVGAVRALLDRAVGDTSHDESSGSLEDPWDGLLRAADGE